MKAFLKSKNIFHYFSFGDRKSSIVERVNRTLQNIIYPIMHERKTKAWSKLLDDVLTIYHGRYHRSIKMTPFDAEKDQNQAKLREIYKRKYKSVIKHGPKFKKGDIVRLQIKTKGGIKRREYLQSFTDEKYKISRVMDHLPIPMFKVSNMAGEEIQGGSFYHWELSRAN